MYRDYFLSNLFCDIGKSSLSIALCCTKGLKDLNNNGNWLWNIKYIIQEYPEFSTNYVLHDLLLIKSMTWSYKYMQLNSRIQRHKDIKT